MDGCIGFASHRTKSSDWYLFFIYEDGTSSVCLVSGPSWVAEAEFDLDQPIEAPWISKRAAAHFEKVREESKPRMRRNR